jgi:hypothetical protein
MTIIVVGALVLCRTLLTALAAEPPPARDDLDDVVHELFVFSDVGVVTAVYSAFRRGVMPVDAGMELLAEVGALDGAGRVTALGRWLGERLAVEVPPPVSSDLPAAALLVRLATLSGDQAWLQFNRWLADRDPVKAADEVLTTAARAAPAVRVVAVDMVAGLGDLALPAWL